MALLFSMSSALERCVLHGFTEYMYLQFTCFSFVFTHYNYEHAPLFASLYPSVLFRTNCSRKALTLQAKESNSGRRIVIPMLLSWPCLSLPFYLFAYLTSSFNSGMLDWCVSYCAKDIGSGYTSVFSMQVVTLSKDLFCQGVNTFTHQGRTFYLFRNENT